MKKVVALRWSSQCGRVEVQPVHEDGSVGLIETTSMETNDPGRFLRGRERIERRNGLERRSDS